ncbi:unnamed protein product [Alternaria alternata]
MPPNNVYGVPTPSEASTALDDTETWYCDFWEKAYAVPHKDGNNIIIYEPKETDIPDPRARPEWVSKRLRKAYELLGEGHPRIVRCISLLDSDAGNGVIVERLDPGPHWGDLPVMTTPVQETPSREDKVMLALYYRWALQALSALSFFHSRSVYLTFFSSRNVWLRSDFSLAITGFISVEGPELDADALRDAWKQSKRDDRQERNYQACVAGRTQKPEPSDEESNEDSEEIPEGFSESWSEGEWAGDGNALFYDDYFNITYPREAEAPWKRDIDWSPFSSPGGRPTEEAADWRDQLQVLEQARLGSVLLKAWKGEYESAEQAAEDTRKIAEEVGINVVSSTVEVGDNWMKLFKDEVDIGEPWEDIFELDEAQEKWGTQTLRFKRKTTHVNLPAIEQSDLAGP